MNTQDTKPPAPQRTPSQVRSLLSAKADELKDAALLVTKTDIQSRIDQLAALAEELP